MAYDTPSATNIPSTAERRSAVAFSGMLLLVLLAVSFPEMPAQTLLGILWTGVGLLMLLLPPETPLPRIWTAIAGGFLLTSLLGFFPKTWFPMPQWRSELEQIGLQTGPHVFEQPKLAAEAVAGFAVTAATAVYLLGHRVTTRLHHRLALGLTLGIGLWTAMALLLKQPEQWFGFFPNRNHSATLLAMGVFAGLGCFSRAIRLRHPWKIGLSVIPTALCLYALLVASESRAGIVLLAVGFVAWILLTGFNSLHGHTGKAVLLLLIGFVGMFLIVDSKVKDRLTETVGRIDARTETANEPGLSFNEAPAVQTEPRIDGRIAIYQDTWNMIRHEPWTGVGPGQFSRVFPQYRDKISASNDARCLHPESDWLMMVAENGLAATLCLVTGIVLVFYAAIKRAWFGRARSLRMGTLVAAMILCFHGIFDVPGHRVGLAWAAALLLGISLRPVQGKGDRTTPRTSKPERLGWRSIGFLIASAGAFLLHAQSTGNPVLPSAKVNQFMEKTEALYHADQAAYERATAEGRSYQPTDAEDPLEKALTEVSNAIKIAPLDSRLHYVRGALALHFDEKNPIATRSFTIQRLLDPTGVRVPLEQAKAWVIQNPEQAGALWKEALRRAEQEQNRHPKSQFNLPNTYQTALGVAGRDEKLNLAALKSAENHPTLLAFWARSAPPSLVDREIPPILLAETITPAEGKSLFLIWKNRGNKAAIDEFARLHPSFSPSAE